MENKEQHVSHMFLAEQLDDLTNEQIVIMLNDIAPKIPTLHSEIKSWRKKNKLGIIKNNLY